jgi:tRNA nucleotidyltransferase (CCA-adding enzyme)
MGYPISSEIGSEAVGPLKAKPLAERAEEEKSPDLRNQLRIASGISGSVKELGGKALVVGGFVRDEALRLMGEDISSRDVDLEVYKIGSEELLSVLNRFGKPDFRGEQFAIVNVGGVDVSIPRRDSKIASGHRGFKIEGDPQMTFREASRRRDFTVNAIAIEPGNGKFLDEWGGISDLKNGVLRAVDLELFADDPLRPLRAAQLAARFGFSVESKTAELCRSVNISELSRERVGEEWLKLLKASQPSNGLSVAKDLRVLEQLHLDFMKIVEEPDRWEHLCKAVDAAAVIVRERGLGSPQKEIFILSTLCLSLEEGARRFLSQINISRKKAREILPLVRVYPPDFQVDDTAIRRLAVNLYPSNIEEFSWVLTADNGGKPTKVSREILEKAERLSVEERPPIPLLSGDLLLEMGVPRGPEIGEVLDKVFEAQLKGEVTDLEGATRLARGLVGKHGPASH